MTRGLPYSLVVHALLLLVVIVYGNHVSRRPPRLPRAVPFRFVHMPRPQAQTAPRETPPPPVEEQPAVEPEAAPRKTEAQLPPKEVPDRTQEQKPQEAEPEPRTRTEPEPEPEPDVQENTEPVAAVAGPRVGATDSDFPFAWYLTRIEALVDRHWNPRQMGFRGDRISCTVHFEVSRAGTISGVSLTESSGIGVFDREALRAVMATRLPPLPPQYRGASLGVSFIFNLEPDH